MTNLIEAILRVINNAILIVGSDDPLPSPTIKPPPYFGPASLINLSVNPSRDCLCHQKKSYKKNGD